MSRPGRSRHAFTPEEDVRLMELIAVHGTSNWAAIAEGMNGLLPRQCRERWKCCLSPGHINPAWTSAEDSRLRELYAAHGPKWALITTFFPGRSDYNVKNRWTRFTRIAEKGPEQQPQPERTPWPDLLFEGRGEQKDEWEFDACGSSAQMLWGADPF
jgi:hypothetical protein